MGFKVASPNTNNTLENNTITDRPFEFQMGVGQVGYTMHAYVCVHAAVTLIIVFFDVVQVIKGLDHGIMQMSKGEKSVLQVPAVLGYGTIGE